MEGNLDTIVDEPLEGSQCTDHDDTGNKTLPDTLWTQFLQDLKNVMALANMALQVKADFQLTISLEDLL